MKTMKDIGRVMVAVQTFGCLEDDGIVLKFRAAFYDQDLGRVLGVDRYEGIQGVTKAECIAKVVAALRAAGLTGSLRLTGPTVCGYCGQNCTQYPKHVEATACKGLKAAWRADERAEQRADSRAALDFEDRAYGRD